MATRVEGEMYFKLDGKLMEIKRQLRQKDGYPHDPEELSQALQDCIEGRFNIEGKKIDIFHYFTPLADADVPAEHQGTLAKYRKQAAKRDVPATVPLCYRVRASFTLKCHAPQAGPCKEDFQRLQNRNFEDKPSVDCLVFWVPRLVESSTSKMVDDQRQLLADLRQHLELPEHHLSGFGEASLLAGLILAHFKITGERLPLNSAFASSDAHNAFGDRLGLGFGGDGLFCAFWYWDDGRDGNLGVFALGVDHVIRE